MPTGDYQFNSPQRVAKSLPGKRVIRMGNQKTRTSKQWHKKRA